MKSLIPLLLLFFYAGMTPAGAQCPNFSGDVNTLPVCGFYGDVSGNSNWNWELTDKFDPSYCSMWYARTDQSGNLTPMKSPFVDASTTELDIISQQQDFTRAKGWELLRRDFGCSHVTAYPYFILYNKYTGMMRIFIYVPPGQENYSGIAIEVKPNLNSAYPATTAFSDTIQTAPDKYLTTTPGGNFGKGTVAIGKLGGQAAWSLVEFNPSFDPNIQNAIYTGQSLEFTIFGVTNNNMFASIKGGSVTSTTPIFNYAYRPTQPRTPNGNAFDFKGVGEKFTKFSSTITNVRTELNGFATSVVSFLTFPPYNGDTLFKKILKTFEKLKKATSTDGEFDQTFGKIGEASKAIGSLFKVFSAVSGIFSLFSGSGSAGSGAGPTYTTYDLTLQGTVTTRVITSTFLLRVPGTIQNNNDNATYYRCPMGIFNIKNTPQADVIAYRRTTRFQISGAGVPMPHQEGSEYVSYRIKNDLTAAFNDGAGLDLVSAQAAIVGEIMPKTDGTGSYDLFEKHDPGVPKGRPRIFNHMRPELESGRLEIKQFDVQKKLHVFQTPYVDIGCINGLAFNVPATTRIYLQVKAVLKKENDPLQAPIVYIQNYEIDKVAQTLTPSQQSTYIHNSGNALPPYANYTELPLYISDKTVSNTTYTSNTTVANRTVKADNSIATSGAVIVSASLPFQISFIAGGEISLNSGFEARPGSTFEATINSFGFALNCLPSSIDAYIHPVGCFNTAITALRMRPTTSAAEAKEITVKVYPIPAANSVYISGIQNHKNSTVSLVDQSGRTVRQIRINSKNTTGTVSVDVSGLSNGIYYIKIQTDGTITTRKIVVSK
jgi:hypothetical protein